MRSWASPPSPLEPATVRTSCDRKLQSPVSQGCGEQRGTFSLSAPHRTLLSLAFHCRMGVTSKGSPSSVHPNEATSELTTPSASIPGRGSRSTQTQQDQRPRAQVEGATGVNMMGLCSAYRHMDQAGGSAAYMAPGVPSGTREDFEPWNSYPMGQEVSRD